MKIDLYGMTFDGPAMTYYLWSPWRCSALEHRLFESIQALPNVEFEKAPGRIALAHHGSEGLSRIAANVRTGA